MILPCVIEMRMILSRFVCVWFSQHPPPPPRPPNTHTHTNKWLTGYTDTFSERETEEIAAALRMWACVSHSVPDSHSPLFLSSLMIIPVCNNPLLSPLTVCYHSSLCLSLFLYLPPALFFLPSLFLPSSRRHVTSWWYSSIFHRSIYLLIY